MKILIAPDSFKGYLSAEKAAEAIEEGIREAMPSVQVQKLPMADGGEGTVASLINAMGGKTHRGHVTGPLGEKVDALYGMSGDKRTAVIEMASAAGLTLIPEHKRNPLITTTYGVGELIKLASFHNPQRLIIGLGGSATNDGGSGCMQALGAELLDPDGHQIGFGGEEMIRLASIKTDRINPALKKIKIIVASDVTNPLCGDNGASKTYGPQKGATPQMAETLDEALLHFASIIKKDLGRDVLGIPGGGAAGGLGAGLTAFLDAELTCGVELILKAVGFEEHLKEADLVVTGEGKIDSQTARGKTLSGIARLTGKYKKPLIAFCGILGEGAETLSRKGLSIIRIDEKTGDPYTNLKLAAEASLPQTYYNLNILR